MKINYEENFNYNYRKNDTSRILKEKFVAEMKEKLDQINRKAEFELHEMNRKLSSNKIPIDYTLQQSSNIVDCDQRKFVDDIIGRIKDWDV